MTDPGGSSSALTPRTVTAIRAVDLMATVRGKPVVLWPVFVMALQTVGDREGGSHWPLWRRMSYDAAG